LTVRIAELEQRLDDSDYDTSKKLKDQGKLIASQLTQIDFLKNLASQLQQTTSPLPQQLEDLTSRTGAVEGQAGQALGDASAAKQSADSIDKKLSAKISEVDARATHASEGLSKVEDRTSTLATRAEALEKELDRRARQIEARTEELGERTVALKEREDRIDHIERAAVAAILSQIKAQTDDLDTRTRSAFYRFFNKSEARRESESLYMRIVQLATDLRQMKPGEAKAWIDQLAELGKRVEEISARVK
jgi:chromosome segregation ATPase